MLIHEAVGTLEASVLVAREASQSVRRAGAFVTLVAFASCSSTRSVEPSDGGDREYVVSVERMYPHARDAFTEGLVYRDGLLYESTGQYGSSSLRRIVLETGDVAASVALPIDVFAEGLAAIDDRLVQLSYASGRAFVYEFGSLQKETELQYEGEGWGLCHDGDRLVMSDGTSTLQFRNPSTFELIDTVDVHDHGEAIVGLNELECVGGKVFANILQNRRIVRISPSTGEVEAWVDTGGILFLDGVGDIDGIDVLNGIAYVPERDRFLITGKYWPKVFEVQFVPGSGGAQQGW